MLSKVYLNVLSSSTQGELKQAFYHPAKATELIIVVLSCF